MNRDANPYVAPPIEERAETANPSGAFERLAQRVFGGLVAGILAGGLASFSVGTVWMFSAGWPPTDELFFLPAGMLYFGLLCVIYDVGCIVALTFCATLASIVTLVKGHFGAILLAIFAGIAGFTVLGIGDTDEIFPKPISSYVSRAIGTAAAGYAAAFFARYRAS